MKRLILLALVLTVCLGAQLPHRRNAFKGAASSTLDNGLQAYWKLDESSGSRSDSIGSATLTDNNTVTSGTGIIGNAAQFTAANSEYLSKTDGFPVTKGDEDFTYSCWVNMDSVSGIMAILGNYTSLGPYVLWFISGGNNVYWSIGSGLASTDLSAASSQSASTWYHVVASYDATANQLALTINNGTTATASFSGGSFDNNSDWYIGRFSTFYFDGRIDEVGLWSRVLTSGERTELYNSGAGFRPPSVP